MPADLRTLELRLAQDLAWLNLPAKPWVQPRPDQPAPVLDVAIVGAGMLGLTATAALRNLGIDNVRAFDRAATGREGPWITSARMETLRTRKDAAGPALGIPSLTFRAWYEAQHGADAFARMDLAPREMWMDYLIWYRRVLGLPVQNDTAITAIDPREDGLIGLSLDASGAQKQILARRVVLATGIDGLGAPSIPAVASAIGSRHYAHSADIFDLAALAGKRVAVVGAGASAMDNAAAALEAGAAQVGIFVRRDTIPRIDKFTGIGSRGMTHGYAGLPDETKWRYMVEGERAQIPPPRHSVLRVSRHSNARFHLASPILSLAERDGAVEITTPKGRYAADFIIFATGFSVDFTSRPELSALAPFVRRWRDVYAPPEALRHESLAEMPYLGPGFEFTPLPGAPKGVSHVHCFAFPAVPSHGKITSGIPSIGDGAIRLSQAIARSLFVEDRAHHLQAFLDFAVPELVGDEWTDADQKDFAL
jgi:cation diffusion facilitator CzcD-associated flavoprotein CzcO